MYVHCYALSICQLPDCNLFTQHAIYLMGETPLVNCGPRSFLLYWNTNLLQYLFFTVFLQTIIFHTIRLILCYSKPVRLTTSLFRWGKVLWLCCAGSTLAPESLVLRRTTSRRHQPSTCFLAPPGSINLGFFLRENLLLCASYLPLGVPNERVSYTPSSSFSGAVAGEIKTRCKGSLHFSISLLCFCLALFYLLLCLLHYIKTQKN